MLPTLQRPRERHYIQDLHVFGICNSLPSFQTYNHPVIPENTGDAEGDVVVNIEVGVAVGDGLAFCGRERRCVVTHGMRTGSRGFLTIESA